jgi:uncharacterized protein YraI
MAFEETTDSTETTQSVADVTASAFSYPVAPGVRLKVRSGPGTKYAVVSILPEGASVTIFCQKAGETISGYYGTTNIWDNIGTNRYVSDAYVKTGSDGYVAPHCG